MADREVGRREPSGDRLLPRIRGRLQLVLRSAGHLAISAVERVRIANRAIVGLFETLARHRGAAEALLLRGRVVGRTAPLVSTIAFYRLLLRVGSGDLASIPPLRRQFGTVAPTEEEMWAVISLAGFDVDGLRLDGDRAVLRERLAPFIDAELHSTNASVVLEWLVGHDVYELDDEHLGRHLEQRLTLACERRYEADCAPRSRSARASRRATIERLHQAGQDPISPVFLSGSTLLDAVTGRSDERRGELELGTFGDLAGLGETLARSGFSIEHLGSQHLRSRDERTQIAVDVHRFEVVDELVVDRGTWFVRWHQAFEPRIHTFDHTCCFVPGDVERYLEERFGNWRTPTLFRDAVLDSPNTTVDVSPEAILALQQRCRDAFENGIRHTAYVTAQLLRDLVDVDVTEYLPQPAHRKVLWTPPSTARDRDFRVAVASRFEALDADLIRRLTAHAAGRPLVAAVHRGAGGLEASERMASVKSLACVDDVVLYESAEDVVAQVDALGVDRLILEPDAAITTEDISNLDLTSGRIQVTRGSES